MAQDVQGMLIRIEATTAQLRKELAEADRAVSGSSSKINKELGLVDKAFARMGLNAEQSRKAIGAAMAGITAAAAGGVAGLGALVVSTANSAREIQNLSQVANASTTEFQLYAVGAKTVGIEQEKLSDILKDVNDRIGDFVATGGGPMKDFFEQIAPRVGVTAEQFRKLSGPQALQLYYDSLQKANLSQADMTFYLEAMASDTTALIPLLKDGGAGFSAIADEAERLGLIMSENTLRQFEAFNAQIDTAKMAAGGFGTQIATEALPALSELTGLLVEFAQDSEAASIAGDALGVILKGVATAAIGVSTTFANVGRALGGLAAAAVAAANLEFGQASSIIDQFTADNEAATAQAEQRIKKLWTGGYADAGKRAVEVNRAVSESSAQLGSTAKKSADDQKKAIDEKLKSLDGLIAKYDPAAKAQAEYEKGIRLADEALLNGKYTTEQYQKVVQGLYTDLNKPIWDKHNKQAKEAADAIKKIDDQLESVRDRLDPVRAATKRLTAEKKLLKEGLDAGRVSLEEYQLRLQQLDDEYKENTRATSDWAKWTESALERVDSAFADAWRNIGDGFSSFRDSLTNAFRQMLAELAHMAITRPIIMQIGAALGIGGLAGQSSGLFGMLGGGSGGGMGGMLSSASNLYSLFQAGQGQGLLGSIFSGFKSGGFGGAFNGATSYFGNMFGGIDQGLGQIYGVLTNGAGSTYAPLSYQAGVQGWGNMAATAAPWLAGGLGALMGYQNAGVKGAAAGAAGAAGGYYAGSALGSLVGPLGTVVGGAIGSALGGLLGGSLFGGKWQTKDVGIALGINSGELTAQEYEFQKKKGGLFSSNKKRTRYYDLDPETAAALGDVYDATANGVFDLFESLSFTIEDSALAGLNLAKTNISTMGKTEEEIQQAIAEWFGSAADAMTAELNKVFATGLDLDFEGMQAFVGNLQGVNEVLRYLDVGMYDASVAGGKLAERLAGISGGFDVLAGNAATYYGAFFTEAERMDDTLDAVTRAFADADVTLAGSREAYRAMVEDIDLTTEAGQQMFATLMSLSGQAAAYYDVLEQRAAAEQARLAAGFNDSAAIAQVAFSALQAAIGREASKVQMALQKTTSNIASLNQLSSNLTGALQSMRLESQAFDQMTRRMAQQDLAAALGTARAGGSLLGVDLSSSLSELGRSSTGLYGSFEEYARDYWRTANDINELNKLTGKQLSTEEQALANQQLQLEKFDQMLADAQAQLNALYGIDSSVLSVAAALAGFQAALKGAQSAPRSNQQLVEAAYQSVLKRGGEADGIAFWTNALNAGTVTAENLAAVMAQSASQKDRDRLKAMGVPGFAAGGFHSGGLRLVGEGGPELEVTGPARIYNAADTAALLRGGGDATELRALRGEVSELKAYLYQITKNTGDTVRNIREQTATRNLANGS